MQQNIKFPGRVNPVKLWPGGQNITFEKHLFEKVKNHVISNGRV